MLLLRQSYFWDRVSHWPRTCCRVGWVDLPVNRAPGTHPSLCLSRTRRHHCASSYGLFQYGFWELCSGKYFTKWARSPTLLLISLNEPQKIYLETAVASKHSSWKNESPGPGKLPSSAFQSVVSGALKASSGGGNGASILWIPHSMNPHTDEW